jgi:hypothetical protein
MNPTDPEHNPLISTTDVTILMHRDAHFSGNFQAMLDYYAGCGIGALEEISLEQIEALAEMERKTGHNLAAVLLEGADAEKVARAKELYKSLRDLYDSDKPETRIPTLIADLILSEEENPENEIQALVNEKENVVPSLIELIKSEELHDPLFPGYGRAPELAAQTLGRIGDQRAIATLFESVHENEFFEEDTSLQALKRIGAPAKEFLINILKSKPINIDNERAAIALIEFEEDPEIARHCFSLLQDPAVLSHIPFSTYLVLGCSGLKGTQFEKMFRDMAADPKVPAMLRQDMKAIISSWPKK